MTRRGTLVLVALAFSFALAVQALQGDSSAGGTPPTGAPRAAVAADEPAPADLTLAAARPVPVLRQPRAVHKPRPRVRQAAKQVNQVAVATPTPAATPVQAVRPAAPTPTATPAPVFVPRYVPPVRPRSTPRPRPAPTATPESSGSFDTDGSSG